MTQKAFIEGISLLKTVFIDWKFDLSNPIMVNTWYSVLSPITDEDFAHLTRVVCRTKVKAPSAPAEFFQIMAAEEEKNFISPGEAFNKVLELIRTYGFVYGSDKIYSAIADNQALTKTVHEMESELRELMVGDEFVPERFRKAYRYNVALIAEKRKDAKISRGIELEAMNRRRISE